MKQSFKFVLTVFAVIAIRQSALATTLVEWGMRFDDAPPPEGITNVVAVTGGVDVFAGLRSDGTVIAWGLNFHGETNIPPGLSNVVAISAAGYEVLALKSDGTLTNWGEGTFDNQQPPEGLSNLVAIAAGDSYDMALKSDGTVVTWGAFLSASAFSGMSNIVAMATDDSTLLAVQADGTVLFKSEISTNYDPDPHLTNAVAVAVGIEYRLVLHADGHVTGWLDYPGFERCAPPPTNLLTNIAMITGHGWGRGVALRADGTLVGWGCDTNEIPPASLTNVIAIAHNWSCGLALISDGPPPCAPVAAPQWTTNGVQVPVQTQYHHTYRLEYKNSLSDSNWIAFPLIAGNGKVQTLTDPSPLAQQRFYRVRQW